jgi:transposase
MMDTTSKAKEHTSKWWVWAVRAPNAVVYHLDEHRSKDAAATLLSNYHGVVMCDGYVAYLSLANQYPDVLLAHCWSHIRREFHELEERTKGASEGMLALIDELFAIDREAKKLGEALLQKASSASERVLAETGAEAMLGAARKERSSQVLAQLIDKALAIGLSYPKENALYKACATMAKQWEGLTLFVRHPSVPLHNNSTEQSQRGPVIGRNNHQGSRSQRGTRVSAVLYTLVESAKLAGVDPERYLLLCVRRALMAKPPVTPSEVTVQMLIEDCALDEAQASSAIAG